MSNKIIDALKRYPNLSINAVARKISVDAREVTKAQMDYLRPFIFRDSPLWGPPNSSVKK